MKASLFFKVRGEPFTNHNLSLETHSS